MAASEKRLTSMRRLSSRPGAHACCQLLHDEVHELAGDDDLLDDLLAVDVAPHPGIGARELQQLLPRGVRRSLHTGAALAVHLDDEGEDVACEQGGIGLRPWVLPHPPPRD